MWLCTSSAIWQSNHIYLDIDSFIKYRLFQSSQHTELNRKQTIKKQCQCHKDTLNFNYNYSYSFNYKVDLQSVHKINEHENYLNKFLVNCIQILFEVVPQLYLIFTKKPLPMFLIHSNDEFWVGTSCLLSVQISKESTL